MEDSIRLYESPLNGYQDEIDWLEEQGFVWKIRETGTRLKPFWMRRLDGSSVDSLKLFPVVAVEKVHRWFCEVWLDGDSVQMFLGQGKTPIQAMMDSQKKMKEMK